MHCGRRDEGFGAISEAAASELLLLLRWQNDGSSIMTVVKWTPAKRWRKIDVLRRTSKVTDVDVGSWRLSCILPIADFTREGHWVRIITHYPVIIWYYGNYPVKWWVTFLPCYLQAPTGNLVYPAGKG